MEHHTSFPRGLTNLLVIGPRLGFARGTPKALLITSKGGSNHWRSLAGMQTAHTHLAAGNILFRAGAVGVTLRQRSEVRWILWAVISERSSGGAGKRDQKMKEANTKCASEQGKATGKWEPRRKHAQELLHGRSKVV